MLRAEVDPDVCVSAAECLKAAPAAFRHDEDGIAHATGAPEVDEAALRLAAARCPSGAITLFE